ncbi:MAG: sensor histidine kinase [Gammaproteobacteria bacterium SHHR-1]
MPHLTRTRHHLPLALLLCLLAFGLHAQATEPLALGPDIPYGLLIDPSGQLDVETVAALPDSAFDWRNGLLSAGYRKETHWLRLHLPASAFAAGELWFEAFPPYLDDLRLFQRPRPSGNNPPPDWQIQQAGDRHPLAERPIRYRYFVFALPPPGAQGMDLLIRIQTRSAMMLEGKFWSPAGFFNQASRSTAYWSFYLGLATLATVLAIAITLTLRSRVMLAVSSFSVSYLFLASIQGLSQWLLLPGLPLGLIDQHTSVLNFLIQISMLWVGREVLRLPLHHPRLDRLYLGLMAFIGLLMLSSPTDYYGQATQISYLLFEAGKLGLVIIALRLWIKQGLEYGLIGLVFGLFSLSSLSAVLSVAGLIPLIPGLYLLWHDLLVIIMLLVTGISVYRVAQENKAMRSKQWLEQSLKLERDACFRQRQFLGMVSHEFRSPLSLISLAARNLRANPPLDQTELDQRADKIQRATQRLIQLTDNCLADARFGSQLQILERQPYSLYRLIKEAADMVKLSGSHQLDIQRNGVAATLESSEGDCLLNADPALLRIALSNLLDNAIKYSPPGRIELHLWIEPEQVRLQVANPGRPIPAELQARIFERHVKGPADPDSRSPSGAGLGLFIAREIIQAHDGELSLLHSTASETRFEIRLPRALHE